MRRAILLSLCIAGSAFGASAPPWVQTARATVVPPQPADTPAVILFDETVLANSGDEVTTKVRRAIKVLTPAGRDNAYGVAGFDNNTKLRALRGWSISPSGEVKALRERDAIETSAADFEVFTDARMKILDLPAEVGSVIAFEYETRERPYEPVAVWRFQEAIPVLRTRFEARFPADWKVTAKWMNYPAPEQAGPVWELTNIAAIKDEPRMPELATVTGRAGISWTPPTASQPTRSWNDVARWFHSLAAPRLAPTPAVQAKTRTLTLGAPDPVRALARFAQRDVRYVAVAIGIGGYQPHATGEIFTNSYGDCKDKATLLKAMLKESGVESHYVLVHTTRGMVEPSFPTIVAFNHVISAIQIPKERAKGLHSVIEHPRLGTLLLFDPTSTTTPFGQLPPWLQASRGLLVTADGGELIDLPSAAPEASELRRRGKLQIDMSGTLQGTIEETRTGDVAASMRSTLQAMNATERTQFIDQSLAAHLARHTAAEVAIENLDDPEADLVIRYKVTAPAYASQVADMILIRPRVLGSKAERTVALAERKYAYVTEGPSLHTDEIEITLPPSMQLDELPKPLSLATPDVQYTSSSAFEKGVLRYKRRYAMTRHVIDREALPKLNEAFAKISADERASAVFK